jgi:hypothetical protein
MPKRVMHLNIIRYYYLCRKRYLQQILAKTKGPVGPFAVTLILFYFMPASFWNCFGVLMSPTCP